MTRSFARLEQFWILQIGGWGVYSGGVLIGLLPHFLRREVAYDLTILLSMFAATFVLRAICGRSFQRGTAWPRAMLRAVFASLACAVPCSIVAVWVAYSVQGGSMSWPGLLVWAWCSVVYAAMVMTSWSGLYLGIKHYQLFRSEHARAQRAEDLARSAKLQALRFQLQPHFLFNTLNSLSTLMLEGRSNEASHMVVQLGNFLRRTLSDSNATEIPLENELSNVREYIDIEQARLGDRLKVEYLIAPEVAGAVVPPLLLQPLVENAIYHGIASRLGGGTLSIEAKRAGSRLCLRVCDTGAGIQSTRRGIGLTNTFERLRVLYGDDQKLAVRCPNGEGCLVEIDLPYSTSPAVRSDKGDPVCVS